MAEVAAPSSRDTTTQALKVPPHSIEAEQSILGGLMLDNNAWEVVADRVTEEDFYRRDHRLVFRAITALAAQGKPFDAVTVSEYLSSINELENAGGLGYFGDMVQNTPSASNIRAYADIVRSRSILRHLIAVAGEISNVAFHPEGRQSEEVLDFAEKRVFEIAEQSSRGRHNFQNIKDLLVGAVDRIDALYQKEGTLTGIETGFNDFDDMTSGLQDSDLIIVAGRPSMGKCIVSGSRLVDPGSGALVTIDEMVAGRRGNLLTLEGDFRIRRGAASAFVDDGIKPVYRLRTRTGREIETTLSHPFLTGEGWKPLREIAAGDWIGVPREIPVFGGDPLPEREVRLLAYFVSGRVTAGSAPVFSHPSRRVRVDFEDALEQFPNPRARPVDDARGASLRLIRMRSVLHVLHRAVGGQLARLMAVANRRIGALVRALGVGPALAACGRGYAALAVGERFEVGKSDRAIWRGGDRARPSVDRFGAWLARHGLNGREAQPRGVPDAVLRLPRGQLAVFLNRLFACGGRSGVRENPSSSLAYATPSKGLARDVLHLLLRFGIIAELRRRGTDDGGDAQEIYELRVSDPASVTRFIEAIGVFDHEAVLERMHSDAAASRFHTTSDVLWDPVESVDYMGRRQVYDLTVPETHNFVAEDVVVHNTAFAMNVAEHASLKCEVPVAIFSMEMPSEQLAMRMMSSLGRIDQHRVRTGKLEDDDWPRLTSAVSILAEAPLFIDDTPALTPTELRARARRLMREHGNLGLIIVDYLQLMQIPGHQETRANEISEISRALKSLAKELNVPVMALSQLNRSLEQRPNKRPVMSDLRESGAIEQDADVIVFVYRDEVYNEDSPDKGTAEIIIGKQRNGPIGTTRLTFLGQYTRFENYIPDVYSEGYG